MSNPSNVLYWLKTYFQKVPFHYVLILPTNKKVGIYKNLNPEFLHDSKNCLGASDYMKLAKAARMKIISFEFNDPFEYEDLRKISRFFYSQGARRFSLHTNADNPSKIVQYAYYMKKHCTKALIKILISFDEPFPKKRFQNAKFLRKYEGKIGHFSLQGYCSLTLKNVNRIKEIDTEIRTQLNMKFGMLVSKLNLSDSEFAEVAPKLEGIYSQIYRENLKDDGRIITKRYPFSTLRRVLGVLNGKIITGIINKKISPPPCVAGIKSITINQYGDVYPCVFKEKLGNLRDCNFEIKKILSKKKHELCYCGWNSLLQLSLLYEPRFWPKILSQYYDFWKNFFHRR